MANIAKERIAEIEKLTKASTRKIDGYTKDIEKIDVQIKELTAKKKSLTNSIVSERNASAQLQTLVTQMESLDTNMAELLYLGFATKYGLSTDVKVVAEEKPVVVAKPKRKYNRRSKEEIREHREWKDKIESLYKGKVDDENIMMKRVYSYMLKRYGINATEEKKLLCKDGEYMKTIDVMFVYEKNHPDSHGITYGCVEAVVNGRDA